MNNSSYAKTIVPEAKGFLQVPTIQERKCSEVFCYYPHNFKHEYSGLSIFKLSFEVKTSVKSETLHNEIWRQVHHSFSGLSASNLSINIFYSRKKEYHAVPIFEALRAILWRQPLIHLTSPIFKNVSSGQLMFELYFEAETSVMPDNLLIEFQQRVPNCFAFQFDCIHKDCNDATTFKTLCEIFWRQPLVHLTSPILRSIHLHIGLKQISFLG